MSDLADHKREVKHADRKDTDLLRDYLAQYQAPASDATVRRQLQAGDWVYKRFAKTVPRNAPTAEKKSPGGRNCRHY